jgi:hypothetical protein
MLRPLRAIVVMVALVTGLLAAWDACADEREAALDAAIPAALQKASAPGAMALKHGVIVHPYLLPHQRATCVERRDSSQR